MDKKKFLFFWIIVFCAGLGLALNVSPESDNEEGKMEYCFSKVVDMSFDMAMKRVVEELKKEGFGILTEIDVQATLKKKLDVNFRKYHILGACNPPFAYKALQSESRIGTMLPCNVVVQEIKDGKIEVSAIDPIASMMAVDNPALGEIAIQIQTKLKKVINNL